jgi:hypothetical protein
VTIFYSAVRVNPIPTPSLLEELQQDRAAAAANEWQTID